MNTKISHLQLRDRVLPIGKKTYIVGILNITPDSLGGGYLDDISGALNHAYQLIEDGADILEIGGESTRPGFQILSPQDVINRLQPVLRELCKNIKVPLSIDTYKSEVAQFALDLGVQIVNDVSGLRADPRMAEVINQYHACAVICRDREKTDRFSNERKYFGSNMHAVEQIMKENFLYALENGIDKNRIILDPRIGSGMTVDNALLSTNDCIEILQNQDRLMQFGQPLMSAHSLKTFIGETLGNLPTPERVEGTDAVSAYCVLKGVDFLRIHHVKRTKRIIQMLEAIMYHNINLIERNI